MDDIGRGKAALRQIHQHHRCIKSILEYGKNNTPGVSDLDIMVVLHDSANKQDLHAAIDAIKVNSDVTTALAHANPIILPSSCFDGVFFWDDLRVRDLEGNVVPDPLPHEQRTFRSKAMFVDFVFERIFRVHEFKTKGVPENKHRRCLGVVKSLVYSLNNLPSLYNVPTKLGHEIAEFSLHLDECRSRYSKTLSREERQIVVTEVVADADELSKTVLRFLFDNETEPFGKISKAISDVSGPVRFSFPDGMTFVYSQAFGYGHNDEIRVPMRYVVHPLFYGEATGGLSQKLKSSLSLSKGDTTQLLSKLEKSEGSASHYFDFLRTRIGFANRWYHFLSSRDIPFGLFKFGWYL